MPLPASPSTPPIAIRAGSPATRAAGLETIIGDWLEKAASDKVIVATKVGNDMGEGRNVRKDYILRSAGRPR